MSNLFGNYGPPPEGTPPPGTGGPESSRWFQWLQLGLSCTLLVLFVNQLLAFQDVNRKIARLHERMDGLENSRVMDTAPAVQAQQRAIQERLRQLERALRELAAENPPSPSSGTEIPAFQLPPPPRLMP